MVDRLRIECEGAIGRLLIDRADKRNAMAQAMWDALPDLIATLCADPDIGAIILTGAEPGCFCAGDDIEGLAQNHHDPAWVAMHRQAIRAAQLALVGAAKPIVAAIDGDCVGAGCGLALACDIRVATPRARFGVTPAKLGLVYPLHDTRLLVDLVGPGQAKRILYSGALIDAAEAHRIGLIELMAQENGLTAAAAGLATTIAANSRHSVGESKAQIGRILAGQHDDDDESAKSFEQAFALADFQEGFAAFLGKRRPAFPIR